MLKQCSVISVQQWGKLHVLLWRLTGGLVTPSSEPQLFSGLPHTLFSRESHSRYKTVAEAEASAFSYSAYCAAEGDDGVNLLVFQCFWLPVTVLAMNCQYLGGPHSENTRFYYVIYFSVADRWGAGVVRAV